MLGGWKGGGQGYAWGNAMLEKSGVFVHGIKCQGGEWLGNFPSGAHLLFLSQLALAW